MDALKMVFVSLVPRLSRYREHRIYLQKQIAPTDNIRPIFDDDNDDYSRHS